MYFVYCITVYDTAVTSSPLQRMFTESLTLREAPAILHSNIRTQGSTLGGVNGLVPPVVYR